ncbi:uncharacterized protein LACBIDRAFT_297544 [Laccaria bicolor S238N-H82]|uniref:Predicted protein n=1 Tax=Laccaria bicolor (strain S238N-H82 / ATCC MYA-4686) TaxID=486041 RepID=B0DBF2_LACBS|nr:uncharacterized protein LACBIDRAFT_297544 [Laccaria bicolor S238N-H82]EDR08178.1 predicted protein [Laccaria bicolor S238N-H82]|eukprot:XP_001881248.1 predicted protein [Laccaria bicolor S238N-H82]
MRRRAQSNSSGPRPPSSFTPVSIYSHVSTYRSLLLELQLYSPSLKVNEASRGPLAVFSDHDQVGGKVILDSRSYHTGQLTISIEGVFMYDPHQSGSAETTNYSELQKHIFFNCSTCIAVSPTAESSSPRTTFRDAFIRRRPSASHINVSTLSERSYPFTFNLPQSHRPGEEIPPSFTSKFEANSLSKSCGVEYKVVASWEPSDAFESPSYLEVPILLQPDTDFQSMDATRISPDSWLEMPLKSERRMPVRCAVTLPTFVTFSRGSSIPYFVVFTTVPRSPALAREVASDATISVSLIRQITIHEPTTTFPPTPPPTPPSDEFEINRGSAGLLKRVGKSAQSRLTRVRRGSDAPLDRHDKPLPQLPFAKSFFETRTIHSDICIGFPKRPRQQTGLNNHPSLEAVSSLPDGLHKAKIPLDKEMLPCVDWSGISVKYYLDISVLIGQDDLRARVPIRIF